MRIVKPFVDKSTSLVCPQWLDDLRKKVTYHSELKCGCFVERLPKCIARIVGNRPEIMCELHGFQRVKRDVPLREMIARQTDIAIDDQLIPPF